MRILFIAAVLFLAASLESLAQEFHPAPWVSAARCTEQDAIEADKDLDRLKNWSAVYRTFKLYKQCDDGAIAEGYSDAVAKLLVNRWQTLRDFANLSRQNSEFERFVLWHIDVTVNLPDDKTIIGNARGRCPTDLKAMCKRLEEKAKNPE